jgi:multidrug resistance efflux pump
MELDQIKKKYELELTRLTNSNERLQTELSNKKIDYEKLEAEFKKISGQYRNIDKLNKEKLVDYQKKMATLDSEILLTQNLYKSFIDAKSRVVKKE